MGASKGGVGGCSISACNRMWVVMSVADTVASPHMHLMHQAVQLTAKLEQQLMQVDTREMHMLKVVTRWFAILDCSCICLQQVSISS